mgnify:CR=1 FL=1
MTAFNPKASLAQRKQAVTRLIGELNADKRHVLVGPWRSELGFEASYWIPFLAFLRHQVKHFDERAAIITRGGMGPLYSHLAAQGIDLYFLRDVKDVRRENLRGQADTGLLKQTQVTEWDEAVLDDAADKLNIPRPFHVLHPAWMYWALWPYWAEDAGLKYLTKLTDYAPIPKPPLPPECPLPPNYVAVKFYARATFQYPHPEVGEWVQRTVATIAAQAPVVVLASAPDYDDHLDIPLAGPNISSLPTDVAPEQNLYLQASVLAHAAAFVGTYGGVAQLALRMSVPSLSVYAQWGGTSHAHYALSSYLSKVQNVPFPMGSLQDSVFWRQITSVPEKPQMAMHLVGTAA